MEIIVKAIFITFGIFIFISAIIKMIIDIKNIMETDKEIERIKKENDELDRKIEATEKLIEAIKKSQKEMLEKANGNKGTED